MSPDPGPDWPERAEGLHLLCYADTPAHAADSIEAHYELSPDGALWLRYHIEVPEENLALPDPAAPERTDGLWVSTCCELFLRRPGERDYLEFNFSPSGQWAAYRFSAYREGCQDLELATPEIFLDASTSHLALEATIRLPSGWTDVPLVAALSAVIEETDGTKSYWALRHPPGKPDFHHPDCFALTLEAPPAA